MIEYSFKEPVENTVLPCTSVGWTKRYGCGETARIQGCAVLAPWLFTEIAWQKVLHFA